MLLWSVLISFVLKLIAAAVFPFTGDEAYFVQWGREFAGSYYDHGPVTGWILWSMLQFGDHPVWLRLPAVLISASVPVILYFAWRRENEERAALAASLLAWSLPCTLGFLITTDMPLLFFSALAVGMAGRAHRSDRALDYFWAGCLLGLAFLAKYFAVMIGMGLAVWWLCLSKPRRWHAVIWLLAGVLPFAAQHVYWNYHHSWTNVMFNVITRQSDRSPQWYSPLLFLAMAAWLMGPIAVALLRKRSDSGAGTSWRSSWKQLRESPLGLYLVAGAVPFGILFAVSLSRRVGLHWFLSFYPLVFVALIFLLSAERLRRLVKPMIIFSCAHLLLGLVIVSIPIENARTHRSYASIVLGVHPDELLHALGTEQADYTLTTPSYAKSALLEYHLRRAVPVFGVGSAHGRQDDLRTDWREYAGKNILVLSHRKSDIEKAQPYFEHSEAREIHVRGATFHALFGHSFRYQNYRDHVLTHIADTYYSMPEWLEKLSSGCFFKQRYDIGSLESAGGR